MPETEPEGRARSAKPEVQDCAEEREAKARPGRVGQGLARAGRGPWPGGARSSERRRRAPRLPGQGCSGRRGAGFPPGRWSSAL